MLFGLNDEINLKRLLWFHIKVVLAASVSVFKSQSETKIQKGN